MKTNGMHSCAGMYLLYSILLSTALKRDSSFVFLSFPPICTVISRTNIAVCTRACSLVPFLMPFRHEQIGISPNASLN